MKAASPYIDQIIERNNGTCSVQIVYVDIVSFSRRRSYRQASVIRSFMRAFNQALLDTATEHTEFMSNIEFNVKRDVISIFSGDGAAVAFPIEGIRDLHLQFATNLLRVVDESTTRIACPIFAQQSWCDCHDGFALRYGVNEGRVILFRDLNDNYNIAGEPINMAVRVMDLAGSDQVFFTEEAYRHLIDETQHSEGSFRRYENVQIKHGRHVRIYQYINDACTGLNTSHRHGLLMAGSINAPDLVATISGASRHMSNQNAEESPIGTRPSQSHVASKSVLALSPIARSIQDDLVLMHYDGVVVPSPSTPSLILPRGLRFLIGRHAITQAAYREVARMNPSRFQGDQRPVETVSWIEAVQFCNTLSDLAGLDPVYVLVDGGWSALFDRNGYRLPTEAEWECACTDGGKKTSFQPLDRYAWYAENSNRSTHNVGEKEPTLGGLYDMLGNVSEWCHDKNDRSLPSGSPAIFGGPTTGFERVTRGGSWVDTSSEVTPQYRSPLNPGTKSEMVGFRVVRST